MPAAGNGLNVADELRLGIVFLFPLHALFHAVLQHVDRQLQVVVEPGEDFDILMRQDTVQVRRRDHGDEHVEFPVLFAQAADFRREVASALLFRRRGGKLRGRRGGFLLCRRRGIRQFPAPGSAGRLIAFCSRGRLSGRRRFRVSGGRSARRDCAERYRFVVNVRTRKHADPVHVPFGIVKQFQQAALLQIFQGTVHRPFRKVQTFRETLHGDLRPALRPQKTQIDLDELTACLSHVFIDKNVGDQCLPRRGIAFQSHRAYSLRHGLSV